MTTKFSTIGNVEKILIALNKFTATVKDIHFHQHSNEVWIRLKRKTSFKRKLIESIKQRKKSSNPDHGIFLKINQVEDYWMGYHKTLTSFDITDIHYDSSSKLLLIASENAPFELMVKTTFPDIAIMEKKVKQVQLKILGKN